MKNWKLICVCVIPHALFLTHVVHTQVTGCSWVTGNGCGEENVVTLPHPNIGYRVQHLPNGAAGWIHHQMLKPANNGNLCVRHDAMAYPTKQNAEHNQKSESNNYYFVVFRKNDKLHIIVPKEYNHVIFFQPNEFDENDFENTSSFQKLDLPIDTLEQSIREGIIANNLTKGSQS